MRNACTYCTKVRGVFLPPEAVTWIPLFEQGPIACSGNTPQDALLFRHTPSFSPVSWCVAAFLFPNAPRALLWPYLSYGPSPTLAKTLPTPYTIPHMLHPWENRCQGAGCADTASKWKTRHSRGAPILKRLYVRKLTKPLRFGKVGWDPCHLEMPLGSAVVVGGNLPRRHFPSLRKVLAVMLCAPWMQLCAA